MKLARRYVLQGCSVALVALVNAVAIAGVEVGEASPVLVIGGVCAVAAAVHALVWGVEALTPTLLLSVPPLFVLAGSGGGSAWLIAPLAALLLLASELTVVGWEFRGADLSGLVLRRRVARAAVLAAAGAATAVVVMATAGLGPSLGGTAALVVAAGALALLGWVLFGRGA